MGGVRRNPIPPDAEAQILEMPECKRGRFVTQPGENHSATPGAEQSSQNSPPKSSGSSTPNGTQNLLDVDTVVSACSDCTVGDCTLLERLVQVQIVCSGIVQCAIHVL